jgi:hypothetical protein
MFPVRYYLQLQNVNSEEVLSIEFLGTILHAHGMYILYDNLLQSKPWFIQTKTNKFVQKPVYVCREIILLNN